MYPSKKEEKEKKMSIVNSINFTLDLDFTKFTFVLNIVYFRIKSILLPVYICIMRMF